MIAALRRQAAESLQAWALNVRVALSEALPDSREIDWMESIIRYRLQDDLPDAEKDGIPGAVGRSEIGNQDDSVDRFMLSGLFEGREPYYPLDPDFTEVVLKSDIAAGWQSSERLHDSLRYWPDNYYSVTGESLCFGGDFGDDCRLWLPCGNANQASWDPPVFQYAEMYTGEMAAVAQMLFGIGETVPYRYCYERTHIVYSPGNGSKWIVEISIDDGITAWELAKYDIREPGAAIDYTPVPTGETLPYLADRIQLAPASALAPYADADPHFIDCGWAANLRGNVCLNVTYADDPNPSIDAKVGQLWRINIGGDGTKPTGAVVTLVEIGHLFNNVESINNMKMLKREFGGCFRSYQFSNPNNPPPGNLRAPVYATFEGDNEVVIYHRYDPQFIDTIDERQPDAIYGCFDPIDYGINAAGEAYRKGSDIIRGAVWFEISGYDRGLDTPDQQYTSRAAECSGTWQQLGGYVTHIHDGTPGVASQHWRLEEVVVKYNLNPPVYFEQLLIPAHSRKAFLIYQGKHSNLASTKTTTTSLTGYAAGSFIPFNTCLAAGIIDWIHYSHYINPCGCGGHGDIIGKVVERDIPQEQIDEYERATGIPLQNPQPEPNGIYDSLCLYDILCYEQGRTGTRYNKGACEWIDPACVGNCTQSERQTIVVETLEEADPDGRSKLIFYDRGQRTVLMDEPFDIIDHSPYWLIQEDGSACQWMDVMRDVHSGAGTISADIFNPFSNRYVFGDAAVYPIDELNKRMKGWFGVPFE